MLNGHCCLIMCGLLSRETVDPNGFIRRWITCWLEHARLLSFSGKSGMDERSLKPARWYTFAKRLFECPPATYVRRWPFFPIVLRCLCQTELKVSMTPLFLSEQQWFKRWRTVVMMTSGFSRLMTRQKSAYNVERVVVAATVADA